jgi:hypothetical protein
MKRKQEFEASEKPPDELLAVQRAEVKAELDRQKAAKKRKKSY